MKRVAYLFSMLASMYSIAQPNTEIYLLDLSADKISNPINISNNDGYDNQPAFWTDGSSILYSRTVNGQTEIAQYIIKKGKTKIITHTLQGSEYSPTPMPDGRISSVRLDTTGKQLLYAYDFKDNSKPLSSLVVGYHAWISDTEFVAFVLGDTITMQLVNTKTNESRVLGKNIGRSLHKIPNTDEFSYVDKSGDEWIIKAMNPKTRKEKILTKTLAGSEDYCWTPDGKIIMGNSGKLWIWSPNTEWKLLHDVSKLGLNNITRLAVSPTGDKIIVVSQ